MPAGAPTKYKEEYNDLAYKFCLLGATDDKLADFFEVNPDTIHEWKKVYPEFSESIRRGKSIADAEVADSLYQRAKGYSHPDMYFGTYQGEIITEEYTKHYPPDTAAAIIWLKNRQPQLWRDKQEIVNTNYNHDEEINYDELSDSALEEIARAKFKSK